MWPASVDFQSTLDPLALKRDISAAALFESHTFVLHIAFLDITSLHFHS